MEQVSVECYSGARYAERPVALAWRGKRFVVKSVERACRTLDGFTFTVCTSDDLRLELTYFSASDQWFARSLDS